MVCGIIRLRKKERKEVDKWMLLKILNDKTLRRRILYTIFIVIIFRIGVHLPIHGINLNAIKDLQKSDYFASLDVISGGALQRYSYFALGLSPYITASIFIQVLQQGVIPRLKEWSEQGEFGRQKLKRLTFVVSLGLGLVQAFGIAYGFYNLSELKLLSGSSNVSYLTIALSLTLGSFILAVLAETINNYGVGQGISVIVLAGILSELPLKLYQYLISQSWLAWASLIGALIVLILLVYLYESLVKRYKVYNSRQIGRFDFKSTLPIKVNISGVVPLIFASSLMGLPPVLISQYLKDNELGKHILKMFDTSHLSGILVYTVVVIFFVFAYNQIQANPEAMAKNLSQNNVYIKGIAPGEETERFLFKEVHKISAFSIIFILLIVTLPMLLVWYFGLPTFLGTLGSSILIVVGVLQELSRQVRGQLLNQEYRGLMNTRVRSMGVAKLHVRI